ncbi:hypothetical protein PFNF54_03432 [Plasmodium falciparum NF54]|uniref:Uncharacterized protein n=1 Tax=Plasmodium falciparum (isolate NF54) TaxID=5843 RepID=W7JSA6_PLAFO|nr:hypothetical protein PFNF54_03432 [Plasmodium falciparum NF54]
MIRRVTYNTVDIYKGEIKTYMKNILQPIIKISLHCKYPKRCVVFSISFLPEHAFWLLCFRLNVEIKNFSFFKCSEKKNLTFYKIQPDCSEIILLVILCCKNIG